VQELEHELGLPRLMARILTHRGVVGAAEADRFLAKRWRDLEAPESLAGMEAAAARFAWAIQNRERILIHGDYDVDGCTATSLLTRFVRLFRHQATPWVPHRRIDGYGMGEASAQAVKEHKARLMVTVDCGANDHGLAHRIESELSCDVIVTDHHPLCGALPECTAVVNPLQNGCSSRCKHLAGVGVAWKLAWATARLLCASEKLPEDIRAFMLDSLSLVAVGTIADCMPLTGENRILVHHGLIALDNTRMTGLLALKELTGLPQPADSDGVAWKLCPPINAAGRLGSALPAIMLLTTEDAAQAQSIAKEIASENEERRRLTEILTRDILDEIAANPKNYADRMSLVFAGDGWHPGVVGIVAARIAEKCCKPTAIIALDGAEGKGSLRSFGGVSLDKAIEACRDVLIRGGGHAMAAGISLNTAQVAAFTQAFEAQVRAQKPGGLPGAGFTYDGCCTVKELDDRLFQDLLRLAPFGNSNTAPLVRVDRAFFSGRPDTVGKDGDHLRAALTDAGGGLRQLMAFKARSRWPNLSEPGARFDLLVRPETSVFRGERQYRLILVDGRRST
jgi:single-stranded-DNA-specific exonuclease